MDVPALPPAGVIFARYTLGEAEMQHRRKDFASREEVELTKHIANMAVLEEQKQRERADTLASMTCHSQGVLETLEGILKQAWDRRFADEKEKYEKAKAERQRLFDEKEKECQKLLRDVLFAPLTSTLVCV